MRVGRLGLRGNRQEREAAGGDRCLGEGGRRFPGDGLSRMRGKPVTVDGGMVRARRAVQEKFHDPLGLHPGRQNQGRFDPTEFRLDDRYDDRMLDELKVGLRKFVDAEGPVQDPVIKPLLDDAADKLEGGMDLGVLLEAGGIFTLGGKCDGKGQPQQVGLAARKIGQGHNDVGELIDRGFFRRRGFLHQEEAFVHCLVHQGLKETLLVPEVVVEGGLGDARLLRDVLHRRAGVAAIGEEFQSCVEKALPGIGARFSHGGLGSHTPSSRQPEKLPTGR